VRSMLALLEERMRAALQRLGVEADPLVRVAQDEQFGDYQSNCAMGLARTLKKKPRDVAEAIIESLDVADCCAPPEPAGPGFINFRLRPEFLATELARVPVAPRGGNVPSDARADGGAAPPSCLLPLTSCLPQPGDSADRLGLPEAADPQVVVVDLSSPNLAKEMHVGHLRSTVIGDCICRILEFVGHHVHRENHVGDWGTQFGMLVAHLRHVRPDVIEHPEQLVIKNLETFYVEAKAHFDADPAFAEQARATVVELQQGDPATRRIWKAFCDESLRHCHELYRRLDVCLEDRGESCYADGMVEVIRRLEEQRAQHADGPVQESQGALCVFLEGFQTREGTPLPMIVRKRDGGFNYATSDLATLIHRIEQLKAQRIIYVVGVAQRQHFEMLFAAARRLGWAPPQVRLEHLGFGNLLASTGRPFKTREGGTVKLKDLLDEAVARARRVVAAPADEESGTPRALTPEEMDRIAETVGLAAVKYFDLSHALTTDYRFEPDIMLSLEGNTAPYMLYAYARVRAIGRKGGVDFTQLPANAPLLLDHPAEQRLALALARFPETLETVVRDLTPNTLTDYLYVLARAFSRFYDKKLGVPVLAATPEAVRISRLRLCDLTARTLRVGLHLLGIRTLEYM